MLTSEELVSVIRKIVKEVVQNNGSTNEILYSHLIQGRVAPDYSSGRPSILFDGETNVSGKQYPYLSSYSPQANDVVIIGRVSGTYVILGKKL